MPEAAPSASRARICATNNAAADGPNPRPGALGGPSGANTNRRPSRVAPWALAQAKDIAMITPGPRNSLTDIAGLAVGNAQDLRAWSGVTVLLPDRPVLAAVDVRGGSPFTVNTATFDPSNIVKALHGLI